MRRAFRPFVVAASLLALVAAALPAGSPGKTAAVPFYLVPPPPTNECHKVKACVHVRGPWVVVPANREATFLLQCPKRHGSVGGSDARASSRSVHVWFDGQTGSPIQQGITTGPFLLFHAITDDGKPGSFQPVLGCITVKLQSSSRATVSARRAGASLPGSVVGVPVEPRSTLIVLNAGSTQRKSKSCLRKETLVASWDTLGLDARVAPDLSHIGDVVTKTLVTGQKVNATIQTAKSLPFFPLAEVQIGVICASSS